MFTELLTESAEDVHTFLRDEFLGRNCTIATQLVTRNDNGNWYQGVVTDVRLGNHIGDTKVIVYIVCDGTTVTLEHHDGRWADIKFAFVFG